MGDALSAMGINGPFLISQIVNFLVMFGLITVLMWKPARKRLDDRQAMLQQQVEDERVETIKSDASEEAKKIIQKAQVDAKEEEMRLLKGVRDQVAVLAMAATQKLVGATLDEKRQKALIDEFFSSVKGGKVIVLEGDDFQGKTGVITSALPLTDKEKKVIEKDVLQKAGGKLEISYEVDPGILGGLTIKIDDKLFDYSVSSQLAGLRSRHS